MNALPSSKPRLPNRTRRVKPIPPVGGVSFGEVVNRFLNFFLPAGYLKVLSVPANAAPAFRSGVRVKITC